MLLIATKEILRESSWIIRQVDILIASDNKLVLSLMASKKTGDPEEGVKGSDSQDGKFALEGKKTKGC
jgi:hypothetical protein